VALDLGLVLDDRLVDVVDEAMRLNLGVVLDDRLIGVLEDAVARDLGLVLDDGLMGFSMRPWPSVSASSSTTVSLVFPGGRGPRPRRRARRQSHWCSQGCRAEPRPNRHGGANRPESAARSQRCQTSSNLRSAF
jgi:hypothetical protein